MLVCISSINLASRIPDMVSNIYIDSLCQNVCANAVCSMLFLKYLNTSCKATELPSNVTEACPWLYNAIKNVQQHLEKGQLF